MLSKKVKIAIAIIIIVFILAVIIFIIFKEKISFSFGFVKLDFSGGAKFIELISKANANAFEDMKLNPFKNETT